MYSALRKDALNKIAEYEDVKVFNITSLEERFRIFSEVWLVKRAVEDMDGKSIVLNFYICFPSSFPHVIPRIALTTADYNKLRYLPHIDSDHFICTYDAERTLTDTEDPVGIINESLKRARNIIE